MNDPTTFFRRHKERIAHEVTNCQWPQRDDGTTTACTTHYYSNRFVIACRFTKMQRIVCVLLILALGTGYSQHAAAWIMWPPSPACATRQSEGVDVQPVAHPRALPWLPMSRVTNWVVENLESSSSRITSSSSVQAGENDTLPSLGLVIGQEGKQVRILPSGSSAVASSEVDTIPVVRFAPWPERLGHRRSSYHKTLLRVDLQHNPGGRCVLGLRDWVGDSFCGGTASRCPSHRGR
jgi:hypothetical protein